VIYTLGFQKVSFCNHYFI